MMVLNNNTLTTSQWEFNNIFKYKITSVLMNNQDKINRIEWLFLTSRCLRPNHELDPPSDTVGF